MAFNPQQAKEEGDRINAELMALQEYDLIKQCIARIGELDKEAGGYKAQMMELAELLKGTDADVKECKSSIKDLLESIEAQSGYSKAPGLAHLMTIAEKYEVKDVDAVPQEYIVTKITSSVDKKKLNQAIKDGKIDLHSNWLEIVPSYKTVVLA